MNVKERMHSGKIYDPADADIMREQTACLEKLYDFNATRPHELQKRAEMLSAISALFKYVFYYFNQIQMKASNQWQPEESEQQSILPFPTMPIPMFFLQYLKE